MEVAAVDEDRLNLRYHYCPLVNAWQKLGCTDDEIRRLCDIAMDGDRGIADSMGYQFELTKAIARGDDVCTVNFLRKDKAEA